MTARPKAEPRFLRFTTGRRKKFWNKNCIALGLASGFLEPLESTSIHLIQKGLDASAQFLSGPALRAALADEFNRVAINEYERIRDFIILHYKATTRGSMHPCGGTAGNMEIPEPLAYKIRQFRNSGRVVKYGSELFAAPNWIAVLMGQEIWPERYDTLVDQRGVESMRANLRQMRETIRATAQAAPLHEDYIAQHCRAPS